MIFYLIDLIINNLNIFVCATILFNIGNCEKQDFLLILFIDVFVNRMPIVFISVFLLNLINKWIKKKFVNCLILDNLLFFGNYIFFFFIIYVYKNNGFNGSELLSFYISNFFINYVLFLLITREKQTGF